VWGAQARFWYTDGEQVINPIGDPLIGGYAQDNVNAWTVDLELSRRFCAFGLDSRLTAGVRYADIELESAAVVEAVLPGGQASAVAAAFAGRAFEGTGFTIGATGGRSLGCCSPWRLFYGLRASVINDDDGVTAFAATRATATSGAASSDGIDVAVASSADGEVFFIGEIQAGLEYWHPIGCSGRCAFFRIGAEYQTWDFDAPVFAVTNSFATANNIGANAVALSSGDTVVQFTGFLIGGGLVW
jgi:hypothetical protein